MHPRPDGEPAYVGIGSNLRDPIEQVRDAVRQMQAAPDFEVVRCSSLYRSRPLGPQEQDDFVNAVVKLRTCLAPTEMLSRLLAMEDVQGRQRNERWGPRTLDLDLLLYADLQMSSSDLVIPHPGVALRAFVVLPLLEISPDICVPGVGALAAVAENLADGAWVVESS